ncbi:MAG TPA: ABC transporter ATP-binding protein [Acidimicrobiales bacterium]|nr:ABC transporter ATP-binding protein [Acidimicrobiales bacterium]
MAPDLTAEKPKEIALPPLDPIRAGEPLLSVRDLRVQFKTDDGILKAVDGVSYDVYPNEVVGIVGESGSGKSVSSLAIMGLLPKSAKVTGEIVFRGQDLLNMPESDRRKLRGGRIAMVFQDALAALNPVFTVGDQIEEAIAAHQPPMAKSAKRQLAMDLLDLVGIPNPTARVDQYPHEFSGGMRQRAMIAMSIANEPDVLIADEPTTALDVTIQAQVLEVLERIQERTNSAIVLITHDLGVVAGVADRVMVMYAGRPVEMSTVDEIFYHPRHPYTLGLMASLPRLDAAGSKSERLYRIKGQPPSLIFLPPGCPFNPRCEFALLPEPCATVRPDLELVEYTYGRHTVACHRRHDMAKIHPDELKAEAGAELDVVEDAAALSPEELAAHAALSVPATEETT